MTPRLLVLQLAVVVLAAALLAAAAAGGGREPGDAAAYEVWAVDQSNTNGAAGGGSLYVYDGPSLHGRAAAAAVPERIDLAGAATELCLAQTGTAPVRPHMLLFNAGRTHAVLSFVASGHVLLLEAASRRPLACVDVGVQAHAAVPSPDETYVVVANQNGKLLQRIRTDYAADTFELEPAATLDLATGTTPSGAPVQGPARPDNAPICPLIESTSRYAFVTLRGGGLLVVDSRATPMRIVAEYDRATVHGNGCGGLETAGKMYVNSGGGTAANLTEFDVYVCRLDDLVGLPAPPNSPAMRLVTSRDDRGHTDSHGAVLTKAGRYLWVADRAANRIVVVDTLVDEPVGEIPLAGELSDDPSPDLLDIAPGGNRVYVSLRGRLPLSGDPHVSTGSSPGIGVIRVEQGGRTGVLETVVPITNVDAAGVDRADPHALRVRQVPRHERSER